MNPGPFFSTLLAVAGLKGKVRLFDVADGKMVKEFVPVPIAEGTKSK